jgi:hypothetical protein
LVIGISRMMEAGLTDLGCEKRTLYRASVVSDDRACVNGLRRVATTGSNDLG